MFQPRVSVIVPVYNAGEALNGSVESILAQTYTSLELILVDDGSTDESPAICDQFATLDDRVVVVHQRNGGVSSARNTGITTVTGDYLTFVDADDFLHPDALATVLPRLLQYNGELACFGMTFVHHEGQRVVARDVKSVAHTMLLDSPDSLREHFFGLFELNYWSSVWNKVFETQFVRHNQIMFDGHMAVLEDFEFVVKALTWGPRIVVLPDALYDYRIDVTKRSSSRRPDIDYLRNFRLLDDSLERLATAIRIDSPRQVGQLNAMIFRFYLIGVEIFFARPISHRVRYRNVKAYLADERVLRAAQIAAPTRRGVAVMAWLVRHRCMPLVYATLLARRWTKSTESGMRVIVSRVGTSLPRLRPSAGRLVRSRRAG